MTYHRIAEIPDGFDSPFAYSSLSHVLSLWLCDADKVEASQRPALDDFTLVGNQRHALVAVSYQSYLADYGRASLISHELEIGPVVVPPGFEPPTMEDFLSGADQRGLVGIWPSAVYCDCEPAIAAGRAIYGEPKFPADFMIDVPAPNAEGSRWQVGATSENSRCDLAIELDGASASRPGQPIINYGRRESGEVVSSRWDIFVGGRWWDQGSISVAQWAETLSEGGTARHPELSGGQCIQVREHRSPVVAQRSRPFFTATS